MKHLIITSPILIRFSSNKVQHDRIETWKPPILVFKLNYQRILIEKSKKNVLAIWPVHLTNGSCQISELQVVQGFPVIPAYQSDENEQENADYHQVHADNNCHNLFLSCQPTASHVQVISGATGGQGCCHLLSGIVYLSIFITLGGWYDTCFIRMQC